MNTQLIDPQDVFSLVQAICVSMLDMECKEASDRSPQQSPQENACNFIGCVQIYGDWNGAVEIHTDADFGRKAAARMMMIPEEDIALDDIQDAIAELSNMVGGSLKGILPGTSSLSLPSVASGVDLGFKLQNNDSSQLVALECDGQMFSIAIKHCTPSVLAGMLPKT
ncbi:hypothetical protein K227x_53680 [Rubripirellula lacrimiformis]|uniref:Chemotaxis phosphatase CheX-like domain-containing protein n=1 Tax=Rubripirellula lacrimiformis TaxID=1930273 RepID=A0A517NII7_9BACT|nr:chemotaxis protein CheX [Rubripirellula lacrimiformis]QDT06944.1 hypothetical protein K227x_53680 [Rubripirellula lacrimiformis]